MSLMGYMTFSQISHWWPSYSGTCITPVLEEILLLNFRRPSHSGLVIVSDMKVILSESRVGWFMLWFAVFDVLIVTNNKCSWVNYKAIQKTMWLKNEMKILWFDMCSILFSKRQKTVYFRAYFHINAVELSELGKQLVSFGSI